MRLAELPVGSVFFFSRGPSQEHRRYTSKQLAVLNERCIVIHHGFLTTVSPKLKMDVQVDFLGDSEVTLVKVKSHGLVS